MAKPTKGWMPGAIRKPDDNGTSKIYKPELNKPFELLAVVEHIAEGGEGTWKWLFNETADGGGPVSSHFFVAEDGDVYQGASIYHRTWANGLTWNGKTYIDPQKAVVQPTWHRIAIDGSHRGQDPNKLTVSVEHEGWHNKPRTTPQMKSSLDVLHYVQSETGIVYIAHDTLIGHYEISTKNRANCPGPHFDLEQMAINGNGNPLKVRSIPGPDSKPRYCGTGFYDFWIELGGQGVTGFPLEDEHEVQDDQKEKCTVMAFERCVFKYKASQKPKSVHLALLSEAIKLEWV